MSGLHRCGYCVQCGSLSNATLSRSIRTGTCSTLTCNAGRLMARSSSRALKSSYTAIRSRRSESAEILLPETCSCRSALVDQRSRNQGEEIVYSINNWFLTTEQRQSCAVDVKPLNRFHSTISVCIRKPLPSETVSLVDFPCQGEKTRIAAIRRAKGRKVRGQRNNSRCTVDTGCSASCGEPTLFGGDWQSSANRVP
jgi:hypothetical protein